MKCQMRCKDDHEMWAGKDFERSISAQFEGIMMGIYLKKKFSLRMPGDQAKVWTGYL
jgi:hypothetical protein